MINQLEVLIKASNNALWKEEKRKYVYNPMFEVTRHTHTLFDQKKGFIMNSRNTLMYSANKYTIRAYT